MDERELREVEREEYKVSAEVDEDWARNTGRASKTNGKKRKREQDQVWGPLDRNRSGHEYEKDTERLPRLKSVKRLRL